MIRQYELIDKVQAYNENADVALLNRAYVFSMKAHGNQKRASGEPYLVHPLEVSSILADLRLDDASIAVGLLHDTLEDTLATYEELENLFGKEVADITEGVTKLSRIEFNDKQTEQAENYRKLFLSMSKDIRVLLIKLCDRLHNMRTLHHIKKPEKRKRIAQETMDIYIPLAHRIGLYSIKTELEDIAFRELNTESYEEIEERKKELRVGQNQVVERVIEALQEDLEEAGIHADIKGREKTVYSIYRKMSKKNLTFDQLTDIIAYRIIAEDKGACYEVLGRIHNLYKAIPGRFKDYISAPKSNGYQSLHTSVIGPFGNRMEIQIRDKEMDEVSESGVAAHWLYKHSTDSSITEGMQYKWIRQLMDTLQSTEDPEEFIENTKLDLFKDEVFVFSPQGDIVSLPSGATPLDFAYYIHSEIGNTCQTAKVNGRVVPLRTQLSNGDQIEIITAKNQNPTRGWAEFVVTGRAKSAITRYLRQQELDEKVRLGRDILEKAARRESLSYTEKSLLQTLEACKATDIDDLYAGIAQGRIFPRQIFDVLYPERNKEEPQELPEYGKAPAGKDRRDNRVAIDGLTPGMAIHIAKCCNPLPGEPIVGIINTGRGITIHNKQCSNLTAFSDEPDRWLDVRWNAEKSQDEDHKFQARLSAALINNPGSLSSFSTALFNVEANIIDLYIHKKSTDALVLRVDVEVNNLEHFEKMMAAIRNLKCVNSIERLMG